MTLELTKTLHKNIYHYVSRPRADRNNIHIQEFSLGTDNYRNLLLIIFFKLW